MKHNYQGYKEIEVPTGQWMVSSQSTYDDPANIREVTRPATVIICRHCGDVKVKLLKLPKTEYKK